MTREEVKIYIGELKMYAKSQGWDEEYQIACDVAMNELEQEPFINKTCVSEKVCEHDKNVVIDKIRAEIETKYGQCDICEYFEDYDYEENDISEYRPIGNIADILQIIDKYKAESEET